MNMEIAVLIGTAASIGFLHTLLGPDHYLPFIVMSKARKWTLKRTGVITFLCGSGHVLSSVGLGLLGAAIGFGIAEVEGLKAAEGSRGNIASWLLIGFGLAYFIWGVRKALKRKTHTHVHLHDDTKEHIHQHAHSNGHVHVHQGEKKALTPWILFTIFIFGPCEPLIPILMYPAYKHSIAGMVLVATVFSVITIATMLGIVVLGAWGVSFAKLGKAERFAHAMAGAVICLSGLAIQLLGL